MTEDDTFLKLKRIDLEELFIIIDNLPMAEFVVLRDTDENLRVFLKEYGWTLEAFQITVRAKYA